MIRDVRIAANSVAPTVTRCYGAEAALRGRVGSADVVHAAMDAMTTDIAPIDDVRSTAAYRHHVAKRLLEEALLNSPVSATIPSSPPTARS